MTKFSSIIIACSMTALPLHAETSVIVTLTSIGDRIRAQNPDLAAARLRIKEVLGRSKQSGRLKNPELETAIERNTHSGEGRFEIGFSQRFPLTDRLRLEQNVSLTEFKSSQAEVREVERLIVAKARELVVRILANRQRRELLKEQSLLSEKFADFLTQIAAKGEGSAIDAGQAKLDAATLAMETRRLTAEETSLLGELKPLLGMRTGEALHVSGSLPEPTLPTADFNPSKRPDFQQAKLDAQAAAQAVTLEQAQRYEELEAGVFAGGERSEDAPEGISNDSFIGLRFKMPLPFWNKNEGAIQEAQARQARMNQEAIALGRN
ncbi:MAG: TolC family protein, partial [Gloeobacteraceae cyanobacterium ES-bin-144]|nr:TolC family protein [Verrucomicrobiales bacterium]